MKCNKVRIVAVMLAILMMGTVGMAAWASAARTPYGTAAKANVRVAITPLSASVNAGGTLALTAKVIGGTAGAIHWSVERGADVGTIDENGVLTALAPGDVYVRATDKLSGQSALRKVTVKAVRVKSVKLAHTSLVVDMGEAFEMPAPTVLPKNATVQTVKWTSASPRIATVDQDGVITGVSAGMARITCTVGSKKATCTVRVRGENTTMTISAVGDVILGGDPNVKSALNRSTEEVFKQLIAQYGTGYPFKNVASVFQKDDLTIANLEGTLTTNTAERKKTHVFKGDPSYARILKNAGIEVCNLANNHTMDFKKKGLSDTQKSLNAEGIRWCDFTENATYTIEKDGLSVKVGLAGFQTPVLTETIQARVKALKKKCDLVVVSFHWGETKEWVASNFPSDRRRARTAIAAGADLVLGHHRHVPAGIEMYRGKYIAFDLSNFVVGIKHKAAPDGRPLTDSMIFQWTFRVDSRGIIEDEGIKVIPCTTTTSTEKYPATDEFGEEGAPVNNFQPDILTGAAGRAVIDRIQALSTVPVPMG